MRPQPADHVSGRRRRRPWWTGSLLPRLDRIITTLIAVPDHQIPAAIEWGSTAFSRIPLQRADSTTELEVLCGWRKRSRFAGIMLQYKIVR